MTRVSWVSRAGWFGREIERFEIVVVGLDLGADADGVAHVLKDADDFVHGANQRVFHAESVAGCRVA